MEDALAAAIEAALGARPIEMRPLGGGHGATVTAVTLPNGETVVAKASARRDRALALEAYMLRELKRLTELPVPEVLHAESNLLVMTLIAGASGGLDAAAQAHAAELVAALHRVTGAAFGYPRDTVIGGLAQPNPLTTSWRAFFRDHRLLYMARRAREAGRLPAALSPRIERLASRLAQWIDEPSAPALIHGDLWGGNILSMGERVSGFVDPAIYYADPEIELAFATLFGTFGEPFFARYREIRGLDSGFFDARRDLYNLYPLLVHVRLFGGRYVGQVERTLKRFGC